MNNELLDRIQYPIFIQDSEGYIWCVVAERRIYDIEPNDVDEVISAWDIDGRPLKISTPDYRHIHVTFLEGRTPEPASLKKALFNYSDLLCGDGNPPEHLSEKMSPVELISEIEDHYSHRYGHSFGDLWQKIRYRLWYRREEKQRRAQGH